VDVVGYILFIW